jgi:hypothetical protein
MGPVVKLQNYLQTSPGTKKSQHQWGFRGVGKIEVNSGFEVVMKNIFWVPVTSPGIE